MKFLHMLVSVVLAHAAGVIGSIFTMPSIDTWYASLSRPSWNPPNWIFGPVWLTLYTLMGIAAFFVWERRSVHPLAKVALGVYAVHLVFNAGWSIVFFGQQNLELGFYWILVLDALIIATLVLFFRVRKVAGFLLLPYLSWALFATYLNYTIWMLN